MARIIKLNTSKWSIRKIIIIAAIGLLVIGAGVWAAFAIFSAKTDTEQTDTETARISSQKRIDKSLETSTEVYLSLDDAIASGDVAAIEKVFNKALQDAPGDPERISLYYTKAQAMLSAGDKEKALEAGLAAAKLDTEGSLGRSNDSLVANTAYDLDKKATALEYYKKLLKFMKSQPLYDGDTKDIERRIKELEAS